MTIVYLSSVLLLALLCIYEIVKYDEDKPLSFVSKYSGHRVDLFINYVAVEVATRLSVLGLIYVMEWLAVYPWGSILIFAFLWAVWVWYNNTGDRV